MLEVLQRKPDTREYDPPLELIWNTNSGAAIHSLKQAISDMLFIETEHISMAKHFHQRFEWAVIEKSNKVCEQMITVRTQVPFYLSPYAKLKLAHTFRT